MVNSEELIVTTEYLTQYTRCRINRCRYNRVRLYFFFLIRPLLISVCPTTIGYFQLLMSLLSLDNPLERRSAVPWLRRSVAGLPPGSIPGQSMWDLW
jgi:hypothetical protein